MSVQSDVAPQLVVTGASTGIGRATALHLDRLGARVFATVRKEKDREALRVAASERLVVHCVDLLDRELLSKVCGEIVETAGAQGLQGLVNNAGISVPAPLEFQSIEDFRRQLDVNLVAQLEVTQLLLESLRSGHGRIVNVSSMGGYISNYMLGAYCCSKYGLEALSDTLRRELRPWDISVSAIQPGSIATDIWERGTREGTRALDALSERGRELYGALGDRVMEQTQATAARGIPAQKVAEVIEHALYDRRPRTRYRVGMDAKLVNVLRQVLPDRWIDAGLGAMHGIRRGTAP